MTVSQQKIIRLEFESLKNLNECEIDFSDKNLTAILGTNGCGKSTILHALACCYKPIDENKSTNYKFSYFFTPTTHSVWEGSRFKLIHEYRIDANLNSVEETYSKEIRRWKPIYARRTERRQFKSEVHHLEGCPGGTHRDSLMFTTTKRHPHELHPAYRF